MNSVAQDIRYACHTLRHSPGFTLVALATLALSLGANTAIFSFVNAVLLKPLPYAEPDRIVRVLEAPPGGGRNGISTLNYANNILTNSANGGASAPAELFRLSLAPTIFCRRCLSSSKKPLRCCSEPTMPRKRSTWHIAPRRWRR